MLQLSNREDLVRNTEFIPLIEQVGLCVSSGSTVRAIVESDQAAKERADWIVYADDRSRGIALNAGGVAPDATPLRRHINYAVQAQKLARCFRAHEGAPPLYLQDTCACPAEWRVFRVSLATGDLLCAVSLSCPELVIHALRRTRSPAKAQVALQAHLQWNESIAIGALQVFTGVLVTVADQDISGSLSISGEGYMTVSPVNVEPASKEISQASVQVRVDLGEIELTLEELAALRVGTKLELAVEFPLQCYLRIGSSTLGVGEISRVDGGMQLTLKEMIA
jgi:flagellar motor switch/type III secretory pathway protein FliN